ncbi:helix-turn-helix domain-containing protein [Neptunomonas phycophila]|jgi:DNA-binding transcriptional MerR regulator|uniref:Helix-turn-helix domain-containing protein n=1 Tax=Neptunomonas phycophila TaxID=1572645 RepID=A0AAW7XGN9_9GAMM|nr:MULTISPECIES: helix-turn-helix domain-containing protein [Neptunomonas]MBT3145683.1 helix-turn-helix domain-containing protein [Neptunomonas phycophila]MDN2660175.1 helix-turn-helix domain-containing protein [Neptunomonas sp. CHC150]MDO6453200.1 helix-turn-helix domain-containing protein [Neptunomonas phycophila]MDO6469309.1 helix-turn-helix domain-containing protein [Neptunomonas phycophila]MDO6784357.1 helix-turn-helix domain-containing protein [Neptunomonas phycophila]
MAKFYAIGQLSKLADCKVSTIRWYEERGFLEPATRTEGNQRRYTDKHVTTLRFIRHARALGFDLTEIQKLRQLNGCCYGDHIEADTIAQQHLLDVRDKIKRLQAVEAELVSMIEDCHYEKNHQCRILEVLADHDLCETDHKAL